MKQKFRKLSKICLGLFLVAVAILVGIVFMTKSENIELPFPVGIFFVVSMVAMLVCVAIAFVLDGVESIKKDKFSYIIGLFVTIIVTFAILVALDYFLNGNKPNLLSVFVSAMIVVCGSKAGTYIYAKN